MRTNVLLLVVALSVGFAASGPNAKSHQSSPGSRVLGRAPPNAIPDRCKQRTFLEMFPFFHDVPLRYRSQEMALLIEYARFANQRAPLTLRDFVSEKKIYQARTTVDNLAAFSEEDREATLALLDKHQQQIRRSSSVVGSGSGRRNEGSGGGGGAGVVEPSRELELAKAHKMVRALSESMGEATRRFSDIVHSIGETLHDPTSGEMWESACKTHWWPFEDDVCMHLRCTACLPAVAASASVCKMSGQPKSHRCMQKVMGEGYCNYCIVEFTDTSSGGNRRKK